MSNIKPDCVGLVFDLSLAEGIDAAPISRVRMKRVLMASLLLARSLSASKTTRYGAVINLRLCGNKEAKALNQTHRNKPYAPNVLTFEYPSLPRQAVQADIAICLPVIKKEAKQQGKTLEHHFIHLLVHGCLHALGHDHLVNEQAEIMENLERQILKRFRINDPYLSGPVEHRLD
jgi:probable rRNA maturation factor